MSPVIKQFFIDKLVTSNSIDVHVGVMISLRTCVAKRQIFTQIFTFLTSKDFKSICWILASLLSGISLFYTGK